ncbi:hypothetical protein Tco_0773590 [Tanacetum coccineum]|uniref:Uncharacterized protein n=1 Tax=Tanacetum coccineum TaxID=301880 RepID=A0ABQ4ZL96_9ASTR
MEGNISRLHLNNIEYMLLLVTQNKLNNLSDNVIVYLAMGLRTYTRRIVIQSRVEDLQLGLKRKRLMRTDELYKFSDDTLTSVCNTLDQMLKNLGLGYNKDMKMSKWIATDQKQTRIMIKDINQQLLHRRIMRSLEKFIGGRDYRTDYRLLHWTM